MNSIQEVLKEWVNMKTEEGLAALHYSSFKWNLEIIEILIEN